MKVALLLEANKLVTKLGKKQMKLSKAALIVVTITFAEVFLSQSVANAAETQAISRRSN